MEDGVGGVLEYKPHMPSMGEISMVATEILFYWLCQDQLASSLSSKMTVKRPGGSTAAKATGASFL